MAGFIQAIAVDLDGTIAHGTALDGDALVALAECRAAGTAVLLVTGRIEAELLRDFPELLEQFDAAVLENGAVLLIEGRRTLTKALDPSLAPHLQEREIPIRQGAAILACPGEDAQSVLDVISELGLDAQLVHNRSELMVLPAGVSKGTGMRAALTELDISVHNTIAIGDAENDLSLLADAEVAVAAHGAVDSVRRAADLVLTDRPGERLADLLRGPVVAGAQAVHSTRRALTIGTADDGTVVSVPGAQAGILVCGESGHGKSHLTGLLVERWIEAGYTVLVIDPEGDHASLAALHRTVLIRPEETVPADDHLLQLLSHQSVSVVLDLSGMPAQQLRAYLEAVALAVESLRAQYGLPHWIVVDEAHGVLDEDGWLAHIFRPSGGGYCYVTHRPELLCTAARSTIDVTVTALGSGLSDGRGMSASAVLRVRGAPDRVFTPDPRDTKHVRHRTKYQQVALPERARFRFRDGAGHVIATATTVADFVSDLRSVPDESIVHHALRGDFSRWAVGALQDRVLGSLLSARETDLAARIGAGAADFRDRAGSDLARRYGYDDHPVGPAHPIEMEPAS
ncbi:MAG TPA: HAD hydrolase family protein [Nakamurella sp.]|nr:HAD hydrolase family protein [Nakamurella sp.]